MTYYIPETGRFAELTDGSWRGLSYVPPFEACDCFLMSTSPSSACCSGECPPPAPGTFAARFAGDRVTGIDINQFTEQVATNKMWQPSMGCYSSSSIQRDAETNQLYLIVPQTGGCVFFKLHERV